MKVLMISILPGFLFRYSTVLSPLSGDAKRINKIGRSNGPFLGWAALRVSAKIMAILLLIIVGNRISTAQQVTTSATSTGFFYPLGTTAFYTTPPDCGLWLERDTSHGGCYTAAGNTNYHIGFDMFFNNGLDAYGSPAFAAATGTVKYLSYNGWTSGGTTNMAVAIQSTTTDGTSYYSIYGHLLEASVVFQDGDVVSGGTQVGTIGTWSGGDHVHFGIFPVSTMPQSGWGMLPDSSWAFTNGATDPLDFITTKTPTCQNGGTNHYSPGGNHAIHPNGSIIKIAGGDGTIYVLQSGLKRGIPSRAILNALYGTGRGFDLRDVITISGSEFNFYGPGAVVSSSLPGNGRSQPDGRIIRQQGQGTVYIVTNDGNVRGFASAQAFLNLGYQFCNIATITDIQSYPVDPAGPINQ